MELKYPRDVREVLLRDLYRDDKDAGRVLGSGSDDGRWQRDGVDAEGILAIDGGALRIPPLLKPGWRRAGLSYGPFVSEPNLTVAAFLVHGHNQSQLEPIPESLLVRLDRWLRGSETLNRRQRFRRWLRSRRWKRTFRLFRRWRYARASRLYRQRLDENFAVGWFSRHAPEDPVKTPEGAYVVRSLGPANSELCAGIQGKLATIVPRLQDLPIYFLVSVRRHGMAYYVGSVPGAAGLAAWPGLRPVAIDLGVVPKLLHAGVHQSLLGNIGFRADTRVHGVAVAKIDVWDPEYGTAHAADDLRGAGPLDGSPATIGGQWSVTSGILTRTRRGVVSEARGGVATLETQAPTGLVCAVIGRADQAPGEVELLLRYADPANHLGLLATNKAVTLRVVADGVARIVASEPVPEPHDGDDHVVQVLDDDRWVTVVVDGTTCLVHPAHDLEPGEQRAVGFRLGAEAGALVVRRFEAHPREVTLPRELDLGEPWRRLGDEVVLDERFGGPAGDLDGRRAAGTDSTWLRLLGAGSIRLTGSGGAQVDATAAKPCPGRVMYALPWQHQEFADIEVSLLPPGSDRGQKEKGIAGVFFWQDEDNYLIVNTYLSDYYAGASISCFPCIDGFEEIFDAVWSNVGDKVFHGRACRLRVVFDGLHFCAHLDNEPIVYRALSDVYPNFQGFAIRKVGILANWEFGTDTGTKFERFVARR